MFPFHATQLTRDPLNDALCGALPTAFDGTITVKANGAGGSGTENGVPFNATPISTCQLMWAEASSPATEHVYEFLPGRRYLWIVTLGRCAALYQLAP